MAQAARPSVEDDSVSDAALRAHFGYRLKRCFNVVQEDLARTLDPFGLRMLTYSALVVIAGNPGLRQTQLAKVLDMYRANLVVLLDELESLGLIRRDKVPTDRRAHALVATAAGRDLLARANRAVAAHEAALMRGIDPALRASAEAALDIIEGNGGRG